MGALADLDVAALAVESLVTIDRSNGTGPHDPAPAQADPAAGWRLKWLGWRNGAASLRRGKLYYTATEDKSGFAVEARAAGLAAAVRFISDTDSITQAAATLAQRLPVTADDAAADLREIPDAITANPDPAKAKPPTDAANLADFAPWANAVLGARAGRDDKRTVGDVITRWLLSKKRLLKETRATRTRPYLLGDNDEVLLLSDDSLPLRATLARAGLNPTEPAFQWLAEALQIAAYDHGEPVKLAHWSHTDGDTVFVSCGPTRYIVARAGRTLESRRNGEGGIVFDANACLPVWDWRAAPLAPSGVGAFTPPLRTPDEVADYTPQVQTDLLTVTLCALVGGMQPLPIMAALGLKDGGKTTLARAIIRLLMGADADVTTLTADEKDFWTVATSRPVMGLDNVDATPHDWLPDALAAIATGANRQIRQLYTTGDVHEERVRASVILTSRTASFARVDVAERVLPILTDGIPDAARLGETSLADDVVRHRDGLLVYLTTAAANLAGWRTQAPAGLPARFSDFASLAWAWYRVTDREEQARPALAAWRSAQALTVGEADKLLIAITEHAPTLEAKVLTDFQASDLVKTLSNPPFAAELPYMGGGKAIANRLRELKGSLVMTGWTLTERRESGRTLFTLQAVKG